MQPWPQSHILVCLLQNPVYATPHHAPPPEPLDLSIEGLVHVTCSKRANPPIASQHGTDAFGLARVSKRLHSVTAAAGCSTWRSARSPSCLKTPETLLVASCL